uniref:NADH-ubiquinone oxidoreductase chain 3 n=1 Tax=Discolomatidae sp. 3 ACP-2013 TaxID=1434486 RepID=A0A3G3FWY6_9CUCU|nr:NADH dehydrogenase subunit 3 [Discolomatidae sp. 3 ACP-2013]
MIFTLLNLSLILFLLSNIIMMMANIFSKKTFMDREKNSPFECGFDPKNSARLPFSIQFFLIAIIFLIFDIEITLLFPMITSFQFNNMLNFTFIMFFFIMILIMGLFHEWNEGSLNWMS